MIDIDLIRGWGNFEEIHTDVFKELPNNSIVVELGTGFGRGLATMVKVAEEILKNHNKKINIFSVDHFLGELSRNTEENEYYYSGLSLEQTIKNLTNAGVKVGNYTIINSDTISAAVNFTNVDYVFIDADHKEENVKRDIETWLPKIKIGGFIGGHDYPYTSVANAVHSMFLKDKIKIYDDSWLVRV